MHLQCCHECRQLAEALRPAIGLVHESLDATARRDLPSFLGRRSNGKNRIPIATKSALRRWRSPVSTPNGDARQPVSKGRQNHRVAARLAAWAFASVVLIALAAGGAILISTDLPANDAGEVQGGSAYGGGYETELAKRHKSRPELQSFVESTSCPPLQDLTEAILAKESQSIAIASLSSLCCTECHSTRQPALTKTAQLATVTRACGQCHQN